MFPLNTWYVAATPDEIAAMPSGALGRKICGQDIVFFNDANGNVAALEDWCPHRGAPLSLGRVCEGKLVCGYHGLADGLRRQDHRDAGPAHEGVRADPQLPGGRAFWLRVDLAGRRRAGQHRCTSPSPCGPTTPSGLLAAACSMWRCDYRLMIDNLMDLTHETYVHANSIGQKEIDEAPSETLQEGDHVITRRFMNDIPAPPFWQMALRMNGLPTDKPVDRWQICHFTPPSQVMIEVGVALAGQGGYEAPPQMKSSAVVVDFITPETETSIWYFWGMARHFKPHDNSLTNQIREGQQRIFSEDMAMLERQQANHLMHPRRKLVNMRIDAGGVYARRILDRIIDAERNTLSA